MLVSQEPPGSLGSVAGVCILGEDDDEAAPETEVEGGEEDRQRRLRDACSRPFAVCGLDGEAPMSGGEVVDERLETLAVGELSSDDV